MSNLLNKLTRHPFYIICVVFLIIPLNGAIIERGNYVVGIVLLLAQVPWFIDVLKNGGYL